MGSRQPLASVAITRTTALFPSAVFIQWDIARDEDGEHTVDIFRSGSPTGPWQEVSLALVDAYHVLDDKFNLPPPPGQNDLHTGLNLLSLSRDIYYYVSVTPPSGMSNRFQSSPVAVEPGLDRRTRLFKRKILRDESTAFRRLNGVPIGVLKRRHWGKICRECYDEVNREATREHCPFCLGTSFEGGYWNPVYIRGRKSPAPVQTQISAHGNSEVKVVTFTVLDYPHLEKKDVLVDLRHNDRYEVQMVVPTELMGVIVHQAVTASLLSRSSVEYTVLVDPANTPSLY